MQLILCGIISLFCMLTDEDIIPIATGGFADTYGFLCGTWQTERKNGMMYEEWKILDDSTLIGKAWIEKDGKEYPGESIVLQERQGIVQYIPTVHNQNKGKAVPFTMVQRQGNTVVFENKEHDFPQRILYMRTSPDSLHARIEGTREGVHSHVYYFFRRVR